MCHTSTYTTKEWTLLVTLSAVTLGASLSASLQAPFYPKEAEKKGARPSEYGLVFGIFELTCFISAPIFGKYIGRLGAECVLKAGTMVVGGSLITFGLLDYVQGHVMYISLSFLVRIVEALGTSAVITSVLSIVVVTFSDSFAKVFSMIEIFRGLGFLIGPTVGSYLFQIGGFVCPFAVVGGLVITNGLILCVILPKIEDKEDNPRTSITSVLKVVPILLDAFCMVVGAINVGFLLAVLEPHIRQFDLSPTALGGMFVISGAVYMIVSPLIGALCDKDLDTKKMILLGSVVAIGSYLIIGPVPYTPFQTSLWLVGIGLVLDGLGSSLMFIPAFIDAMHSAVKYGLPYDITTYALVSGIYASSFSLGAFIGPSAAGILYDTVGFRRGMLFVIAMQLLLIVAMTWFLCVEKRYDKCHIDIAVGTDEEESAPLVGPKDTRSLSPPRDNQRRLVSYTSITDSRI